MLDHVSIPVRDLEASGRFYDRVLATLGWERRVEREGAVGYGRPSSLAPCFWILTWREGAATPGRGLHVCFSAGDRATVHAFHRAALEAGARDAGEPGARPHYVGNFYGCFAVDPDGFKIEATNRSA